LRFLVFQHVAVEHPGIFRDFMRRDGINWDVVELDAGEPIPALARYDALIVMGGPMDVWQETKYPWLVPEKEAIRKFVKDMQRPYLGICLGHQLLADALGGTVGLMDRPEVGMSTVQLSPAGTADPLFADVGTPFACVQWHGAEVKTPPEGAEVLAHNDACTVQAMRFGHHAYGFQYHVEVEDRTIAEWGRIGAYRKALERLKGPSGQRDFERDVAAQLTSLNQAAATLYRSFVQLARLQTTPTLPH
jgi:GMP synthase-like glutamine amidotransferase